MNELVEEVTNALTETPKKTRTRSNTKEKKAAKITKKEQEILSLAETLVLPSNYHLINTVELMEKFLEHYATYRTMHVEPYVYLDTETYGLDNFKDPIISVSIGLDSGQYFNIPLRPFKRHPDIPTLPFDYIVKQLKPILEGNAWLVLHNFKFDCHVLYNWTGIDITYNCYWDTSVAAALLNENHPKTLKDWYTGYALPDLVNKGIITDESKTPVFKFGKMFDKIPFDEVPWNLATYYACHDSFMTGAVFKYQKEILENPAYLLDRVYKLFREIEMPVLPVLAIAERNGVEIDLDFLRDDIGAALKRKEIEIRDKILELLGRTIVLQKKKQRSKNKIKFWEHYEEVAEINLNSPAQLVQKLYHELKILHPVKEYDSELKKEVPKCKTDKKTLEKNKGAHPVIQLILEHRGISKLIVAFVDKLPKSVEGNLDGKVHTNFKSIGAATGRMSSSGPNLQQIPSKFDAMRMPFHAPKGRLLASLDFSQQELRWLAILTGEPTLKEIYATGLDMHSRITCQVKGLDYDMFEQIRNYKGDSVEETAASVSKIIEQFGDTEELKRAINMFSVYEDTLSSYTIERLANEFELARKKIKSTVFGTVYGISSVGLSDQLLITKQEAQELIDNFKAGLPYYLRWEKSIHNTVLKNGYIEDVLGRKRRFMEDLAKAKATPEYRKRGWHWIIGSCFRKATNYPIQASSASQVKKALVLLHYPIREDGTVCLDRNEWLENGYTSQLERSDTTVSLIVHDEIIFDVPESISREELEGFAHTMANAIDVSGSGVEFRSDIEIAKYWAGKMSYEELDQLREGTYDWEEVFRDEARNKIKKYLGEDYAIGMFSAILDDEETDEDV